MVVESFHIDIMPELGRLGANVKRLRLGSGFTQKQLSDRSSVATSIISKIESGTGNPSILTVLMLAKALRVDVGTLLNEQRGTDE